MVHQESSQQELMMYYQRRYPPPKPRRYCVSCGNFLSSSLKYFNKKELKKGPDHSICKSCNREYGEGLKPPEASRVPYIRYTETERENTSLDVLFTPGDLREPFAKGSFMYAAWGVYRESGQPCVCKWPIGGPVYQEIHFASHIDVVQKALWVIRYWNRCDVINEVVKLNMPNVIKLPSSDGRRVLLEPFIYRFRKFTSNDGWVDKSSHLAQKMESLSHFSYHISGGECMLCDLQGGVDGNYIFLTDPAIVSTVRGTFGHTDVGPVGFQNFFSQHHCNVYCQPDWIRPCINDVPVMPPFQPEQNAYIYMIGSGATINPRVPRGDTASIYD